MNMKKVWKYNSNFPCPKCGKDRYYNNYQNYMRAIKKQAFCPRCIATGRIHTEETKQKLSLLNRGKIVSNETKQKLSLAFSGIKNPMYNKIGTNFGKVFSVETKQKMSDAAKLNLRVPEYFNKIQIKAFKRKDYVLPDKSIVKIQGYEDKTLDMLIKKENINFNDIKIIFKDKPVIKYEFDGIRTYYPDAFIISSNTIIETKSKWTWNKEKDKNVAKIISSLKCGYNYRLVVWKKNNDKIIDIKYCPSDIDKIFISI